MNLLLRMARRGRPPGARPHNVPPLQGPVRPAEPPEDVAAAMYRAFQEMAARAWNEVPDVPSRSQCLREFQRLYISAFKGNVDPQVADHWFQNLIMQLDTI